jgi:hypothetical protein
MKLNSKSSSSSEENGKLLQQNIYSINTKPGIKTCCTCFRDIDWDQKQLGEFENSFNGQKDPVSEEGKLSSNCESNIGSNE